MRIVLILNSASGVVVANEAIHSPHNRSSYPRRRVSSTPRPIGSIIAASGILDHPPSRVMTTEYDSAFSRRDAPEVCKITRPKKRGRRECRVLAAPAVSRAILRIARAAHEHTGQREHSGLPCAMALRLTSCSPRRTALLPPLSQRSFASPERDASTATSEPHDFTVRLSCTRQSQLSRPSHLTARS